MCLLPILITLCPFSCQTIQSRNCPTQNGANKNSGSDVYLIIFFFFRKNPQMSRRTKFTEPFVIILNYAYIFCSNKLAHRCILCYFSVSDVGVKQSRLVIEWSGRQMAHSRRGASGLRMRFANSSVGSVERTWWAWCYGNLGKKPLNRYVHRVFKIAPHLFSKTMVQKKKTINKDQK